MHRRLLTRFLRPGDRVLEIGAGPGRFTLAMAAMGARVTVTDLSASQLAANAERVRDAGREHAVEARFELDVRDLSRFADGEFDAVTAMGGRCPTCSKPHRRPWPGCCGSPAPAGTSWPR